MNTKDENYIVNFKVELNKIVRSATSMTVDLSV